jgi:hypothetical protein
MLSPKVLFVSTENRCTLFFCAEGFFEGEGRRPFDLVASTFVLIIFPSVATSILQPL